jgi:hypothetical protein
MGLVVSVGGFLFVALLLNVMLLGKAARERD